MSYLYGKTREQLTREAMEEHDRRLVGHVGSNWRPIDPSTLQDKPITLMQSDEAKLQRARRLAKAHYIESDGYAFGESDSDTEPI